MKKMLVILLAACACCAAVAALTTANLREQVVLPAQSVAEGAMVTNVVAVSGYRGLGEVCVAVGPVAAASSNRTVTVTLEGTNTVSGGWSLVGAGTYRGAEAGVIRVQCQADCLPGYIRVTATNTTAASVLSGLLLAY